MGDSGVKNAQSWAWQGWVTPREEGRPNENSKVKGA